MEVAPSARKHGVSDDAMHHAIRNVVRTVPHDDEELTFFIGPDPTGALLEVIVVDDDPDEEPVIIHAMKLRTKYYRYL